MIIYDMDKLKSIGEFDASAAEMNFDSRQDYFDKLTNFTSNAREYLQSYNPTMVIYGAEVRNNFLMELRQVERILSRLQMKNAILELKNLEDAVNTESITALSDGIVKFGAQMEILTKYLLSAHASEAKERLTILAVDDSPMILSVISNILHDYYRPVCVTSAKAALDAAEIHSPSLFLLDVEMPGMNGFELAETLRANAKFQSTPILFLTGTASRENVLNAVSCGANGYVLKPVKKGLLLSKLKACLGK